MESVEPAIESEPPGSRNVARDVCRKSTMYIVYGVIGLILVLLHEYFIIQLLMLCYTVVLSSLWLLPYYCCSIMVPTWILWVVMYLLTSNSFEFHLFIELSPNIPLDLIKKLKKKARFLVIKVPKVIFTAILMLAFSQFYFQYWSIDKGFLVQALATNSSGKVDITAGLEPMIDWSVYIFIAAFFVVIYIVPLGSDWVYYRREVQDYSAKMRLSYFRNLLGCILHEIRIVYCTPRTPLILFAFPSAFFFYKIADSPTFFFWTSMIMGFMFTCLCGAHKSFDPTFKPSPYTYENSIYARHVLLQYIYFPLILMYFLKTGPADIFGYELSLPQDFMLYTFINYLTLCQTVRVCTSKLLVYPDEIPHCVNLEAATEFGQHAGDLKIIRKNVEKLTDGDRPALILGEDGTIPVVVEGPCGPQLKKLVLVD